MTYRQAQEHYGIQGRSTVLVWLKKHGQLDGSKGIEQSKALGAAMSNSSSTQTPQQRIKEGLIPERPEQLWVADITYLATWRGSTYLSLVTDAYSRKIVGYHIGDGMKARTVKQAFLNALKEHKNTGELVHHSARGVQYCSVEYQELHRQYDVSCSMTDGYDCYQNALAERINGILKMEYLLNKPNDLDEAKKMVAESVNIYNEYRPHTGLKYKTPDEVHRAL